MFALGSSAYPNFGAFGKYVDNLLGELGGERLMKMASGDEMCGQEQAFKRWAPQIFKVACETFCLDDDDTYLEATNTLQSESLTMQSVRFVEARAECVTNALGKCYNRTVTTIKLMKRTNLHAEKSSKATLLLQYKTGIEYKAGDHLGVFAVNNCDLVESVLGRLKDVSDANVAIELQTLKETQTSNGVEKNWIPHERLPVTSLKELFLRYLDITTPPTPNLLQHFATIATDENDKQQLNTLATVLIEPQ